MAIISDGYARTRFQKTVDFREKDLLTLFNRYKFKKPFTDYVFTMGGERNDGSIPLKGRMDLIAAETFRNQFLWWIIAKVNGIEDIWNDLDEGIILKIPDQEDIQGLRQFIETNTIS